ncbi:MAG: efflux RND transporter permease subunit, partial [Candidatus Hydrogenedentes bacterium]|nr:efflux RND transporter permease subunit [Candidatus Hydrogenedentota bacterium]
MSVPPDIREKRGPVAWMAGHGVAANLIMLVCLVGGFMALRNIKQEVFPNIALDMVSVSVVYPGASPEEVEEGILLAIEESIRNIEGVYEITATARESIGIVTVELLRGENVYRLAQEIK